MRNQDESLQLDASTLSQNQLCKLISKIIQAAAECEKMGHKMYFSHGRPSTRQEYQILFSSLQR